MVRESIETLKQLAPEDHSAIVTHGPHGHLKMRLIVADQIDVGYHGILRFSRHFSTQRPSHHHSFGLTGYPQCHGQAVYIWLLRPKKYTKNLKRLKLKGPLKQESPPCRATYIS